MCDLERNRVIDLLPDRNADTVASWLGRHPGIEVVARDRIYSEGARRGAPDAPKLPTVFTFSKTWVKRYVWLLAVTARRAVPLERQ
ncbi:MULTISPECIES: hypothetical protein [unclassified Bradyrhizobium]|uniref:hypothetical protein n=1 Tax=unclassified Bradyrhizobium TaxID=2631580 RepID=UPI001AD81D29|nr:MULTISPECIES: hypothetical protein [unclassified Bradyrhizobium]